MTPKPKAQTALVDPKTGLVAPVWHAWFLSLGPSASTTAEQPEYKLTGNASVRVLGVLANGVASLSLAGDSVAPDNRTYYGTNDSGTKGWHLVADALDVTADLTKAVDGTTNVVTFGLADLADAGTGELLGITRDAKGRIEGTKSVTAGSNVTITDVGASIEIAATGGSSADPRTSIADPIFDFMGKPPTATAAEAGASYPWVAVTIGAGCTIASVSGEATAPGIWRLQSTSGGGTAHAVLALGTSHSVLMGSGITVLPFRFRVSDLSNGTDRFTVILGWGDTWSGAFPNGIALWYSDTINAGALTLRATAGGVSTEDVSSVVPVADAWVSGYLQVNAAGTQVDLYVAGVLEATVSTGLPSVALRPGVALFRNLGTNTRYLDLDYLGPPNVTFTTPR